jgi:hypothetical protein
MREVLNWWLDPFMTTSVGVGALRARPGDRRRARRGPPDRHRARDRDPIGGRRSEYAG